MAIKLPLFTLPGPREGYISLSLSDLWTRKGKPVRFRFAEVNAPEEEKKIWRAYSLIVLWFCFYIAWRRDQPSQ